MQPNRTHLARSRCVERPPFPIGRVASRWALALAPGGLLAAMLLGASCGDPVGEPTAVGVRELWYQPQLGERGQPRPVVVGDIVYFGTGDGYVIARDRHTGAARWTALVGGGEVASANLAVRSGVVVAAGLRHVVGVDAATGVVRWRYDPPLDTVDQPMPAPGYLLRTHFDADDELVYVPAWGASVSAVELTTGQARWVWQPGKSASDTAASGVFRSGSMGARVSGDTVFATVWHFLDRLGVTSEAWVVALDRGTGAELWRVILPTPGSGVLVQGAPALYENLVILATRGGHVWAVERSTRQVAWHYTPNTRFSTAAQAEVYRDAVYFDGGDELLYSLRAADGSLIWKANPGNGATRDLLVTERRVYYPTDGTLRVFDRATGSLVATASARDFNIFETPAAFAAGQVFVGVTPAAWSFEEP